MDLVLQQVASRECLAGAAIDRAGETPYAANLPHRSIKLTQSLARLLPLPISWEGRPKLCKESLQQ